ncbi:creatininase family protein [Moorella naiadis]|uniref:creatininase family protein n=1 Tax=Moorella naiadis (nom. illeg.) TaxID=3093670 RepID=UPI003D9C7DFC
MELCDLTWVEAREWLQRDPVVIVPLGSTEQHGPHLPLKVDIAAADYIARKVAEKTNMLVTPPLNFGFSELWHTYPGTISFSAETFRRAVHDICYSLIRCGFKKFFLLNGHNPNLHLMQSVANDLVDRYEKEGIAVAAATYIFMAPEECNQIGENFRDGTHANEMETSIMLALDQEHVKMDLAQEVSKRYRPRRVIAFEQSAMILNRWPDSNLYDGTYGNPGLATVEKGRAYLEVLIEKISRFVIEFNNGQFNPSQNNGSPKE